METEIIVEKEYRTLLDIREKIDEILENKRRIVGVNGGNIMGAFGILSDSDIKENSVEYVSKLRKEWRK